MESKHFVRQIRLLLYIIYFLFYIKSGFGQTITNTDCIGATPVCANIYVENVVPQDEGFFPNEITDDISCTSVETKNIWYTFTVNQSGKFGFLIKPNRADADYDWSLFNLTNASCRDIATNPDLVVSCNAAGSLPPDPTCNGDTGATGATRFDIQGGACGAPIPNPSNTGGKTPFNDLIDVVAGNTYVLTVSNWSQEPGGYTIDFSPSGDIGIIDMDAPLIQDINTADACIVSEASIVFSENIKCNTISTANVSIAGIPDGTFNLSSEVCNQGGAFDNLYTITFDEPVSVSGSYDVTFTPSTSLPIYDLCDNTLGTITMPFIVINDDIAPMLMSVTPDDVCQINSVTVAFSQDMLCDGVTTNSFNVIGPNGVVNGQTVLENCTASSTFVYEFDNPIVENGEYQLFINRVPGFDLTNECLKDITGDNMFIFDKLPAVGATIDNLSATGDCAVSELVIPFSTDIICNTVTSSNLSLSYQGNQLAGTIVDTNCSSTNPMTLTEITFELDDPISINGTYDVILTTNGIDEVITSCGTPSQSTTSTLTLDLNLSAPTITDIVFPDECNIDEFSVLFSEPIDCNSINSDRLSLTYGGMSIPISGLSNSCNGESAQLDFQLDGTINSNGEYIIDFTEMQDQFVDQCGTAALSASLVGDLTFDNCDSCFIYMPNAFSPNGDNVNENIGPLSNCEFESVSFIVFDRWGNKVHDVTAANDLSWNGLFDGDKLKIGVYVYLIEIQLREFRTTQTRTIKGTFTII